MKPIVCKMSSVSQVMEHLKKVTAEARNALEYEITFSITRSHAEEDCCEWENIVSLVQPLLNRLDLMKGEVKYHPVEALWNFSSTAAGTHKITSGSGLTVLIDEDYEYFAVVLKTSFWDDNRGNILRLLWNKSPHEDFTATISPAIYVRSL